jgi:hypothetical protein
MPKVVTLEILGIEMVSDLRSALQAYPDDMPIGDAFGEPLKLELIEDPETGGKEITLW